MSEKKTRTGSENRKRIVKFTARFTEDEAEIVREKAESSGQTVSTFIRSSSLDKVVNCRTDDRMIDEIMRLGRLQKHLFVEGNALVIRSMQRFLLPLLNMSMLCEET